MVNELHFYNLNCNLNKGFKNVAVNLKDLVIPSKTWTRVSSGQIKLTRNHTYLVITSISFSSDTSNEPVTIKSTVSTNTRQTVMIRGGLVMSATLPEIINATDDEDYGVEIYSVVEITGIIIVQKVIQLI